MSRNLPLRRFPGGTTDPRCLDGQKVGGTLRVYGVVCFFFFLFAAEGGQEGCVLKEGAGCGRKPISWWLSSCRRLFAPLSTFSWGNRDAARSRGKRCDSRCEAPPLPSIPSLRIASNRTNPSGRPLFKWLRNCTNRAGMRKHPLRGKGGSCCSGSGVCFARCTRGRSSNHPRSHSRVLRPASVSLFPARKTPRRGFIFHQNPLQFRPSFAPGGGDSRRRDPRVQSPGWSKTGRVKG